MKRIRNINKYKVNLFRLAMVNVVCDNSNASKILEETDSFDEK